MPNERKKKLVVIQRLKEALLNSSKKMMQMSNNRETLSSLDKDFNLLLKKYINFQINSMHYVIKES
jgi:hypothetical protein